MIAIHNHLTAKLSNNFDTTAPIQYLIKIHKYWKLKTIVPVPQIYGKWRPQFTELLYEYGGRALAKAIAECGRDKATLELFSNSKWGFSHKAVEKKVTFILKYYYNNKVLCSDGKREYEQHKKDHIEWLRSQVNTNDMKKYLKENNLTIEELIEKFRSNHNDL